MQTHKSLRLAAAEVDETLQRANIALDEMLGATPTQALARLEYRAAKQKYQKDQAALAEALSLPAVREAIDALRVAS